MTIGSVLVCVFMSSNLMFQPAQGLDDFGQMDVIGEPAAFDPLDVRVCRCCNVCFANVCFALLKIQHL